MSPSLMMSTIYFIIVYLICVLKSHFKMFPPLPTICILSYAIVSFLLKLKVFIFHLLPSVSPLNLKFYFVIDIIV